MLYTGLLRYNAWSIQMGTWGALSEKGPSFDAMRNCSSASSSLISEEMLELTLKGDVLIESLQCLNESSRRIPNLDMAPQPPVLGILLNLAATGRR